MTPVTPAATTAATAIRSRTRLPALLVTAAAVALSSLAAVPAASAAPGDRYRTFNASPAAVGVIPDGPNTGGACSTTTPAIKDLPIAVSGVTGPITDVRVGLAIEHTKIGDIGLQLIAPNGTTLAFVDRIGANAVGCGDTTGLNGTFAFFDGAPANIAAVAAQRDDAAVIGGGSYTGSSASGGAVPMTAPFANTPANGTWTLRIIDYEATNVGRVYSANVQLATPNLATSAGCTTARSALDKAGSDYTKAKRKVAQARSALQRAKRFGPRKRIGYLTQTVFRKQAVKQRAKSNLAAAQQQKTTACGS